MLNIIVFRELGQKIMYIKNFSYYFEINNAAELAEGEYFFEQEEFNKFIIDFKPELYESLQNVIKNDTDKKEDVEEYKKGVAKTEHVLCLHPSHKCNLACKYCFRDANYLEKRKISFQTAKDAIDFMIHHYAKDAGQYVVDLSGSGEPLLEFELIKEIVEYCDKKRDEICKKIAVMFVTNSTNLTDEMIEYIDKSSLILPGVSIDGDKKLNDGNRVFKNKSGTYDSIVKNLSKFQCKKLGLAVTITPLNQEVDLIYDHLYHLPNVDCISMKFLRSFDNSDYDFDNINTERLLVRYDLLCNNILEQSQKGNFEYLQKLVQGADHFGSYIRNVLIKRMTNTYRCDAGKQRIAVDSNGDIYVCSVMIGNTDFYMGNIYTGIIKNPPIDYWERNTLKSTKCQNCWVQKLCGGECYAVGYLKNNDPYEPYDKKCEIKKGLLRRAMALIEVLKYQYPAIFNKLTACVFELSKHSKTDSAVWSAMKLLNYYGFSPKYSEIISSLDMTARGINPSVLLGYLRNYFDRIDAYQIESVDMYKEVSYPAIAIINKKSDTEYNYLILLGEENENIIMQSLDSDLFLSIPKQMLYSDYSDIVICNESA